MPNPSDFDNDFEHLAHKTTADADAPVEDWMTRTGSAEPNLAKASHKRSTDDGWREPESDGKGGVVTVHFDGAAWCIEDSSLDKPLQFAHLADAEARASELSKDTGHSVCVRGQDGELIAAYGEAGK